MVGKKDLFAGFSVGCCVMALLFAILPTRSVNDPNYDPWTDLNDDGVVDSTDLGMLGGAWGSFGDPITGKYGLQYDSGWIDVSDKQGQFFDVVHNLGITGSFIPRVWGKIMLDGPRHQRFYDGTDAPAGWNETYGGTNYEDANALVQTSDGGYALAGNTWSFGAGGCDFWLVKTDSDGNMEWNKTYGGANDEKPNSLIVTSDGGFALAGSTLSFDAGQSDCYLVKTDANGIMEWNKTYGYSSDEAAYSVVQTNDGGYALAGYTNSIYGSGGYDFYFVKTDANGNMQTYDIEGTTLDERAHSIVQTGDGGYAILGEQDNGGSLACFWLVKYNADGLPQWSRQHGASGHYSEGWGLIETSDGGLACVGHTNFYDLTKSDILLVKTDSSGTEQWEGIYGGANYEQARSLIETSDGGFALAGYTGSYGAGGLDVYFVKTDSTGNLLWSKTYGGSNWEFATSLIKTADGGYALAGYTYSYGAGQNDFYLIKIDPLGLLDYGQFGLVNYPEIGLALTDATDDTLTFYRGKDDPYWNYIRIYIFVQKQNP